MRGHTERVLVLTIRPAPPADFYRYDIFGSRVGAHVRHTVRKTCERNGRVERRSFNGRDAQFHAMQWAKQQAEQQVELVAMLTKEWKGDDDAP